MVSRLSNTYVEPQTTLLIGSCLYELLESAITYVALVIEMRKSSKKASGKLKVVLYFDMICVYMHASYQLQINGKHTRNFNFCSI